jgi:hypothetical protein
VLCCGHYWREAEGEEEKGAQEKGEGSSRVRNKGKSNLRKRQSRGVTDLHSKKYKNTEERDLERGVCKHNTQTLDMKEDQNESCESQRQKCDSQTCISAI